MQNIYFCIQLGWVALSLELISLYKVCKNWQIIENFQISKFVNFFIHFTFFVEKNYRVKKKCEDEEIGVFDLFLRYYILSKKHKMKNLTESFNLPNQYPIIFSLLELFQSVGAIFTMLNFGLGYCTVGGIWEKTLFFKNHFWRKKYQKIINNCVIYVEKSIFRSCRIFSKTIEANNHVVHRYFLPFLRQKWLLKNRVFLRFLPPCRAIEKVQID